jgi:2-(3-amino-3-carboxypropyl)histidine synthase
MNINNINYDLELFKVVNKIKLEKANFVLLQFPEGLKDYSTLVVDFLRKQLKGVNFFIWFESCFGACDIPVGLEKITPNIDLVIQFGHNEKMPDY